MSLRTKVARYNCWGVFGVCLDVLLQSVAGWRRYQTGFPWSWCVRVAVGVGAETAACCRTKITTAELRVVVIVVVVCFR